MQVLNVEVPFYFKSIVDAMNIDFAAVGGTAYTVAGSMIIACKSPVRKRVRPNMVSRWRYTNWSHRFPGAPECCIRECCAEGDPQSGA